MNKMQEISNYIDHLNFKKTFFGGYDREDVLTKMHDLVDLFQNYIEEEQQKQKELIREYELQMNTSQMLITELNKKLGNLSVEQKNIEQEKEKMRGVYKEYCSNILQQYSESLRTLSAEFSQILNNITNLQQNIIDIDLLDGFENQIEEKKEPECLEEQNIDSDVE